ncbi:MAG: hypothetical protein PHU63_00135 [Candidatus ainarchaeum sp.]|nr:hypothetical protein [Candidatus ainarchaeum sp.]
MDLDELKENIRKLEETKRKKISEIRKLNERKRYKSYEQRALEPFVEKTNNVRIGPLKKQMKSLEFRIATQAYTPKKERDILKELKKLEADYSKVREIERARRKLKLVTDDITLIDKDIERIEGDLKVIRDQLNEFYKKQKLSNVAKSRGITLGKSTEEFSLLDMAEIEE